MESPERKWIARVQAGFCIVNQIELAFSEETGVRFQFSKYKSRDRATIFGLDLDDCPVLLALFPMAVTFAGSGVMVRIYSKERTNFVSPAAAGSFS